MSALAAVALVLALTVLGRAAADRLGAAIAAACARPDHPVLDASAGAVVGEIAALALPVLAAAAFAALLAHFAQTRAAWLPRRRIPGAPSVPAARTQRAALDLLAAAVVGGVAVGWLWWIAPRLAALPALPLAAGAVVLAGLAALATAWIALGTGDALLRYAALDRALHMTARERRDDERASAADPRFRALRSKLARSDPRDAIAGSTLLLLGDGLAVAIAWDPVRRPVPQRTAVGRDVVATQLLGLARHYGLPIHRDHALAAMLARSAAIPEEHWPRLAEVVAAVRR